VLSALKHGYRYLDGAQMYGNAPSIKDALARWEGKREDVYVVTKCEWCSARQGQASGWRCMAERTVGFDTDKEHHFDPKALLKAELELVSAKSRVRGRTGES
jgi:aryl-alcohol dehydrogenase-like predicted oxidoreductase